MTPHATIPQTLLPVKANYSINSQVFHPLVELAAEQGISAKQLLAESSVKEADFLSADFLIRRQDQFVFLDNLSHYCCLDDMGFISGTRADFKELGILGLAMLSAPTFADTIIIGAQYGQIGGTFGKLVLIEEHGQLGLQLNLPRLKPNLVKMLVEEQFTALINYGHILLGKEAILAERINVQYSEPDTASKLHQYQQYFQCKPEFDAPQHQFWYRNDALQQTPTLANATASAMCLKLCEDALKNLAEEPELVKNIKDVLGQKPSAMPSLTAMANQLEMSQRSLRSRLTSLGLSYSEIQAEVRTELAIDLLCHSKLEIQIIAEELGYSEPTNFRRAFKKWTGLSPRVFRQQER